MESVVNWFQDWSDACQYAKECVPDLSFIAVREPWSAFAAITAACFLIWWTNERRLKALLRKERRFAGRAYAAQPGQLELTLEEMKSALSPSAQKQAA